MTGSCAKSNRTMKSDFWDVLPGYWLLNATSSKSSQTKPTKPEQSSPGLFTGGSKREQGLSSDYCAIQAQESKHKAQTSSWTCGDDWGSSGFLDSFGLHNNCFAGHLSG